MLADLVAVGTVDGIVLWGAYVAPTVSTRSLSIDAVCWFHGDTGSFHHQLYLDLGARFAAEGVAFLSANRRGHDLVANGAPDGPLQGYAHESVSDAPLDYAPWFELLRARGHRAIAIAGHSGGAVRAVYTQATASLDDVRAVLAVSPGEYDHDGLRALHEPLFAETYARAERLVAAGEPDAYLRPGIPWGASWTASRFVDCFHADNRYSVVRRAPSLRVPALFVFGGEECADGASDELPVCGYAMRQLRAAALPGVTVEVVEGANHGYVERGAELFATLRGWLAAL
ncbi:MAG: alpha/beta hydrolase [Chloroflexi bacterium]|nr:alpha/beta hydrolase [Chloroflexota bacterium]